MGKIDIVILGATGFTGKFVTSFFVNITNDPEYSDIGWGICGRSKQKMEKLINDIQETGADVSKITVIECDVTNEQALKHATASAKVRGQSDKYLASPPDGTTIQMLNTYHKYNKIAEDANVLIVPSCGLASIPAEIGFMYLEKQFMGTLKTVECYVKIDMPKKCMWLIGDHCLVHSGTWNSLVHVLHNMSAALQLRRETFGDMIGVEPEEIKRSFLHRKDGNYWIPYPGPDADVINMSQKYLLDKNHRSYVHFKSYCMLPLLIHFLVVMAMYLYYYMCRFKWFRNQLWRHPKFYSLGFFSDRGPTEKNRKGTKYSFTLTGNGWDQSFKDCSQPNNQSMAVKISGIDPGYETTALALAMSALTLLKEYPNMPKGGVVMPGAAFRDTNIINRLNSNGMKFELIKK